ncbi:hypothetical protein FJZ31_12070 [Candidatus Poribacteria bacterium]|nr:hypothetical protein [Candidatus Poribacteria bacterium]
MARSDEAHRINLRKFVEKAEAIYAKMRIELERDHWGEILIIEPDSGDYFLGKDLKEVEKTFYEKYPDELNVVLRVGTLAVHRFPARARPMGFRAKGI